MNVQVTSVSKKEQKLAKTGAAIFVITQEDIRRSGSTNIPDLLRMVPGVDVAQLDHSNWAVSIRGFNDVYANKVLVLVDGRSVYQPVFSGVIWYAQDVPLEDIERIEVIRGPGGTVWGANAMNGVINIITKSAKSTPGGLIVAGGGSGEQAEELVQYGGAAGASGNYRVYGRYSNVGGSEPATTSAPSADARHVQEGGFRSDWNLSTQDLLTVQGEVRLVGGGETLTSVLPQVPPVMGTYGQPISDDDGNILGRWTHTFLNGSDISLQAYFDKVHIFSYDQDRETIGDIDFQHHLSLGSRNDIVWGLSYRASANRFRGDSLITLNPLQRIDPLYGAFVQDEITITKSLSLTLGSKFEHNAYTGFENEPSAQLVWAPNSRNTLWASAAKAIRQPSNIDSGIQVVSAVEPLPQGAFGLVTVFGNPNPKVEQLRDYEIGYRAQISRRLSADLTGFLSFYRHLQTNENQTPYFVLNSGPPHLVIPIVFGYLAHARNYGAEAFANWNVTDRWRLSPGLTFLHMSVAPDPSSQDTTISQLNGYSPEHSLQVRSFVDLRRHLEWDQTVGYTGRLAFGNIPGYARLDTRIGWRIGEFWDLSIVGQNLLEPRHAEFFDIDLIDHMLDQRILFGKITRHF